MVKFLQKWNLVLYPPLSLQLGMGEQHKITVYRYLPFFVTFIVVYNPILAPLSVQIASLKDIRSPYAYAVQDDWKTESYAND